MSTKKAATKRISAISLNIFLLKERNPGQTTKSPWSIDEVLSKPLNSRGKPTAIRVQTHELGEGGSLGTLHVRLPIKDAAPEWVSFVSDGLDGSDNKLKSLKNKSISAIMLTEAGSRQFVLAFGHGRHMLDSASIEHRFGIRVALNSISPDKIASIDKQTFDATPRISRTQAVRAASVADYEIDAEQDMLRALVGVTRKEYASVLGSVVAGMDSLKTTVHISLKNLKPLLTTALARSQSQDYLKDSNGSTGAFAWVDNFQPISDQSKIKELNTELWNAIRRSDFSSMWMAIPEIIDWQGFEGFAYTANEAESKLNLHPLLDIAAFAATLRKDATLETLKRRHIYMISNTGAPPSLFYAYKSIYFEYTLAKSTHILHGGSWYLVEDTFADRTKKFFDHLPRMTCSNPFIQYSHADEADYNLAVADQANSGYSLLDRKLIQFGGGHSKIEVCDLYQARGINVKGKLVHVKRGRSSASLSHLFAQGLVSSNLMAGEAEFIAQVNKQLAKIGAPELDGVISGKDYELIYAIIDGPNGKPLDIPFFSKVNLESSCKRLQTLGFEVQIMHITELNVTPKAPGKPAKATQKSLKRKII